MSPRVSIICPAYNRSGAILPTLRSAQAQSVRDWELIVASDGSTDDTDAIVENVSRSDRRIRLHRTNHYGHPSGPCNEATALASAPVHAYLAHDDVWEPRHLESHLSALGGDSALVYGRASRHDGAGQLLAPTEWLSQCWHPDLQLVSVLFEPVRTLWKADAVAEVGGWREVAEGLEDWDLWLRLADAGHHITPIDDVTVRIFEDPSTRKHHLACPQEVPLAVFDTAREARSAVRAMTDRRSAARFLDAYLDDTTEWHVSLLNAGELVAPDGWRVREADIARAITQVVRQESQVWQSLRITDTGAGHRVGSAVATQTADHARRITRSLDRHMPRLSASLRDVLGNSFNAQAATPAATS